jgi:superfamily II DNA or RNA helicase
MINLRPYQQTAVNDAISALSRSEKKAIIIEMPTGGGKTVVFSYIVSRAEAKGSKTLILTDRQELLSGTGSTLIDFGIEPEYIRAGRKYPPQNGHKTFVAMAQTLKNRLEKPNWSKWLETIDLIIIDEIHKQEFNRFFEHEIFKGKTIIAVSATPKRTGKQRQLGVDFEEIVHTLTVTELIDLGFLMPDMYFGFKNLAPDMKGVQKNSKGDYSETDMFKRYDNPKLYGGAITAWKTHTPNTISLFFCSNIIHAVRTCIKFCDAGIPSKFVVSSMSKPKQPEGDEPTSRKDAPPEWIKYWERLDYYREYNAAMSEYSGERSQVIKQWKNGEFKVLFNASILTTGFDFPAIETIGLLRATVSEVLYLQMLGRGSRPFEDKTHFNILDFGSNAERLGGYKLPRKWHLYHENKSGGGNPPIKECGEPGKDKNGKTGCGDYILASAKICPSCGYIYPEKKEEKEVSLELMYTDAKGKLRSTKPLSQMSFEELDIFRQANKYKPTWLSIQLYIRGGLDELKKYGKFKGYSVGWVTIAMSKIPQSVKAERELLKPVQ